MSGFLIGVVAAGITVCVSGCGIGTPAAAPSKPATPTAGAAASGRTYASDSCQVLDRLKTFKPGDAD